jgi:hypothetical protein
MTMAAKKKARPGHGAGENASERFRMKAFRVSE